MSNKKIFELQAEVCKALAHPLRIEIIELLVDQEFNFADIQLATGELKSNLSQHLGLMVKIGILHSRKEGQNTYFSITSKKVTKACYLMREILADHLKSQKKLFAKL